jgi:hypothetical protein
LPDEFNFLQNLAVFGPSERQRLSGPLIGNILSAAFADGGSVHPAARWNTSVGAGVTRTDRGQQPAMHRTLWAAISVPAGGDRLRDAKLVSLVRVIRDYSHCSRRPRILACRDAACFIDPVFNRCSSRLLSGFMAGGRKYPGSFRTADVE